MCVCVCVFGFTILVGTRNPHKDCNWDIIPVSTRKKVFSLTVWVKIRVRHLVLRFRENRILNGNQLKQTCVCAQSTDIGNAKQCVWEV